VSCPISFTEAQEKERSSGAMSQTDLLADYKAGLNAYSSFLESFQAYLEIQNEFKFNFVKAQRLAKRQEEVLGAVENEWRMAQFCMSCRAIRTPKWLWLLWCYIRNLNALAAGLETAKAELRPDSAYETEAPIFLTRSLPSDEAEAIGPVPESNESLLLGVGVSVPDECASQFSRVYQLRWDSDTGILHAKIVKGNAYPLYGGTIQD
jgi:hypothetical protein